MCLGEVPSFIKVLIRVCSLIEQYFRQSTKFLFSKLELLVVHVMRDKDHETDSDLIAVFADLNVVWVRLLAWLADYIFEFLSRAC